MTRIFHIAALFLVFMTVSCVREELQEKSEFISDEETLALIEFTHSDFEMINISTKATLGLVPESRVQNMFVCIFVGDKRVYAHYFDVADKLSSKDEVIASDDNTWWVANRSSNDPSAQETTGHIMIKSPAFSGGTIYLITNIDADMVNISPEKLNTVRTRSDLDDLTASLNQEITSRNGYFPMSYKTDIDIAADGTVTLGSPISLQRMDAKVMVNIRVATDNELETTEDGVITKQTLKEFIPESWRVVNLPRGAYVFGKDEDFDESGYFSTEPVVFETKGTQSFMYEDSKGVSHVVESPVNGFSFYMIENREDAKVSTEGDYHLRDKRVKDADGEYTKTGDKWVYAPEDATYLEIKGEVIMTVDVSSEAKQQQLSAAVTYYIHLGDFIHSETGGVDAKDNYDVDRNTIYNYTITIKGVSEIETEVTTSNIPGVGPDDPGFQENETGATGQVYIAKESIYTFDAHYGQRVFCFDAASIDADNVTWYVKTPFGKEGVPEKVGDVEVPAGMDYGWVHFLLNAVQADGTYSQKNFPWPGDPDDGEKYDYYKDAYGISEDDLMDVVEFTQFIKDEKRKFDRNHDDNPDNNVEASKFLKEYDDAWRVWYNDNNGTSYSESEAKAMTYDAAGKEYPWWRYRMYMTVFVDEFYYEKDPISGEEREGLWKEFVNQPNRLMHILCDNMKSFDKESSATGSVITLRQRSIQTPYNLQYAETAWGCETVDEFKDSYMWYYSENETKGNPGVTGLSAKGNTSETNGLYNTLKLLNVNLGSSVEWSTYIDYNRENDYVHAGYDYAIFFMRPGYVSLLYSILQRNRDNNGNGYIDPDEIRWYQSAVEQVFGLYLGGLGLSDEAQLYPPEIAAFPKDAVFPAGHRFAGMFKWQLKVVSSTCRTSLSSTMPITVWAEEGVSISTYKRSFDWGIGDQSPYSVRCARNLGMPAPTVGNIGNADENNPEPLVKVIASGSDYKFDLRNFNAKSLRFYTTRELEPGDEYSEMSRLSSGFVTGEKVDFSEGYASLKTLLESGGSPCPKDWRTPNLREGGLMYLYCTSSNWWDGDTNNTDNNGLTLVSTYNSLGGYGNGKKGAKNTWYLGYDFASLQPDGTDLNVRCVKDDDPATW